MNQQQRNRYLMLTSVSRWMKANETVYRAKPAIVDTVGALDALIARIDGSVETQGTAALGRTSRKTRALDALIDGVNPLRATLNVYARKTGKTDLEHLTRINEWELRALRHSELVERAALIIREAAALKEQLVPYGIAPDAAAALATALEEVRATMNDQEVGHITRVGAGSSLAALLVEADALLRHELDNLMEQFRASHPDFYEGYFNARVVRKLGIRHEHPETEPAPSAAPAN